MVIQNILFPSRPLQWAFLACLLDSLKGSIKRKGCIRYHSKLRLQSTKSKNDKMELSFHLEKNPEILASLNRTVQEKHEERYPELFRKYNYAAILTWFKKQLIRENIYSIVIKVEDQPIGYVLLIHKKNKGGNPFLSSSYNVLEIDQMSILEEFQGKGIGSRTFDYIKDFAKGKGIQRIHLDVWLNNEEALNFYSKLGFEPHRQFMEYLV